MSSFDELVEEMIAYKESMGYSRVTYETILKNLSRYVAENVSFDGILKLEDIAHWCERRSAESICSYGHRICCLRQFLKYLNAMGLCDGIPSPIYVPKQRRRPEPYMFSDDELTGIFSESDKVKHMDTDPLRNEIIPVIYRLIYFCGLRPNEGRELLRSDVNLDEGTLLIRHNKSDKERLIPMADDVTEMLAQYAKKRDIIFPDSDIFFPTPDGSQHSKKWLCNNFKKLWCTAFPEKKDYKIRVYDLRHRFATTSMTNAIDRGENLYAFIPHLCAYMGHSEFSDTMYYIHLLPERIKNSPSFDYEQFAEYLPEVPDDEEDD